MKLLLLKQNFNFTLLGVFIVRTLRIQNIILIILGKKISLTDLPLFWFLRL